MLNLLGSTINMIGRTTIQLLNEHGNVHVDNEYSTHTSSQIMRHMAMGTIWTYQSFHTM